MLLQGDSVVQHFVFSLHPMAYNEFLCVSLACVVKVSLGGVRALADGPFSTTVSLGSTFFVVQKVHVWLHDCCSFYHMSRD